MLPHRAVTALEICLACCSRHFREESSALWRFLSSCICANWSAILVRACIQPQGRTHLVWDWSECTPVQVLVPNLAGLLWIEVWSPTHSLRQMILNAPPNPLRLMRVARGVQIFFWAQPKSGMENTIVPQKFWRPFWIACLSYLYDPNMCGLWFICMLVWSQTPGVNWQN